MGGPAIDVRRVFPVGSRVRMTQVGRQLRPAIAERSGGRGVVCGYSQAPGMLRVLAEGAEAAAMFPATFWEPADPESGPGTAA